MSMQQLLLAFLTYPAQGFMVYYYAKAFLQHRYSVALTLVNLTVGYIALYLLSRTGNTVWNLVAALAVNTVLLLLLYRDTLKSLLFHAVMLTAVQALSELLSYTVMKTADDSIVLYAEIIGRFLFFLLLLVIRLLLGKKHRLSKNENGYWALLLTPLAGAAVVSVLLYTQWHYPLPASLQFVCGGAALLMLIADVAVFFIYERSLEDAARLAELTAIQQKNKLDRQYYELMEQGNQEMKMLAHDMKNQLIALRAMDSTEAVRAYIDKLYPQVDAVGAIGSSGNKMLDLIINKYQKQCQKEAVSFTFSVKTASLDYIADTDLTSLMSNLLDNAVEAARNSNAKTVSLSVFNKNPRCDAVVIENSCDVAPHTINGIPISTKDNRQWHGYGMKSVAATSQKYNALFEWTYDEKAKRFTATVVFPKEGEQ